MRICLVNGSPRVVDSASGLLIDYLVPMLPGMEVEILHPSHTGEQEEQLRQMQRCDVLVLAFPLYADSFPSHVLRLLCSLKARGGLTGKRLYALVNNGFYEGVQCAVVMRQLQLFANETGMIWGQGIGVGAGEMHRSLKGVPLGKGPNKNLGRALGRLAKNILQCTDDDNVYIRPNWPHAAWQWLATHLMWNARAKENGLSKNDLYNRAQLDDEASQ